MPVGGVREKLIAAYRAGLKTVLIPVRNEKDVTEVPRKARTDLNIVPISHMDEAIEAALFPAPPKPTRRRKKKPQAKRMNKLRERYLAERYGGSPGDGPRTVDQVGHDGN